MMVPRSHVWQLFNYFFNANLLLQIDRDVSNLTMYVVDHNSTRITLTDIITWELISFVTIIMTMVFNSVN